MLAVIRDGTIFGWVPDDVPSKAHRLALVLDAAVLTEDELASIGTRRRKRRAHNDSAVVKPRKHVLPKGVKAEVIRLVTETPGLMFAGIAEVVPGVTRGEIRDAFWRGTFKKFLRVQWGRVAQVYPRSAPR
jgi:hypothetical protein